MSESRKLSEKSISRTILQVLEYAKNETKDTPQTISQVTDVLKKTLIASINLDSEKAATYFENKDSKDSLSQKKIESLTYLMSYEIAKALLGQSKFNWCVVSADEQEKLRGYSDREMLAYLLIRNSIIRIDNVYALIAFKQFLLLVKAEVLKLEDGDSHISSNMVETAAKLIAYLDEIESSTVKSKLAQDVIKVSEARLKSYFEKAILLVKANMPQSNIVVDEANKAEYKEILAQMKKTGIIAEINELSEAKKTVDIWDLECKKSIDQSDDEKNGNKLTLENNETAREIFRKINKLLEEFDGKSFSKFTQDMDVLLKGIFPVIQRSRGAEAACTQLKENLVDKIRKMIENKLKYNDGNLSIYSAYFPSALKYFGEFAAKELDKPTIMKFSDLINKHDAGSLDLELESDLIRNILNAVYSDPLTENRLIPSVEAYNPSVEAYNRETQMAYLLSISRVLGSEVYLFVSPNLINMVLSYLKEGTIVFTNASDKKAFESIPQISPISIFALQPITKDPVFLPASNFLSGPSTV